jgi:hypothetical protein
VGAKGLAEEEKGTAGVLGAAAFVASIVVPTTLDQDLVQSGKIPPS